MADGRTVAVLGSFAPSLVNFRGPLLGALAARGQRVFALAPAIDEGTAAALRALGAVPVSVPLGNTSVDPRKLRAAERALAGVLRELAPDLLLAYTITPIAVGAGAARAAGVPRFAALVTGLGYPFGGGWRPKRVAVRLGAMALYRAALGEADVAIFQNRDDLAHFRRLRLLPGGLRTGVVNGSGVDLLRFAPAPPPEPAAGRTFLMVARLLRDKGVREYGEAAAALRREFPDARCVLVGYRDGGPDAIGEAELAAIVAGGVEYAGRLDDVRPALAGAGVYVLPSYREGTPRTVLEAMATGRAVVTTDAPGCRETVREGVNGLLVPPRDAGALAAAIRRFAVEPGLAERMGEASLRIARERYDVAKVNAAMLRLLAL